MIAAFALRAGALSVAAGAVASVAAATAGSVAWVIAGWAVTAVCGVVGGLRMTSTWGRGGSEFFVAFGGCMLARLVGAALGAGAAASVGPIAVWSYLAGLGAGYLPLQVFELVWFWRLAARRAG